MTDKLKKQIILNLPYLIFVYRPRTGRWRDDR